MPVTNYIVKNFYPKTIFNQQDYIRKERQLPYLLFLIEFSFIMSAYVPDYCHSFTQQIDQDLTIYWHGSMHYIAVVTVDLMKTSQVIQTGPSPSDVLQNQVMGRALLKRCCDILVGSFQMQKLPWVVQPCTWSQQQEEMIKIR